MKNGVFYLKGLVISLLFALGIFMPCRADARNAVLLGSIPTDREIDYVALSPDSGIAYGISEKGKSLYIFDLNEYKVKNKIDLGKKPRGLAVNPLTNLAYITITTKGDKGHHGRGRNHNDKDKGFLYVVDPDGNILNTLLIPEDPRGIAINPDNNTAIISIEKGKELIILFLDTLAITKEIPLPDRPGLIAMDTDSNRAVVVAGKAHGEGKRNIVLIVDLGSGTVLYNLELRKEINGIAVDIEKGVAVATGEKEITLIDINTGEVISSIQTDDKEEEDKSHKGHHGKDLLEDIEGVDINQSTHIAVITKEEGFLILDLNADSLSEHHLVGAEELESVSVDRNRNTAVLGGDNGVVEVQLPNPVPRIISLIPKAARAGDSGFTLRVEGEKFITSSTVQFDQDKLLTSFKDNNSLEASVPSTLLGEPGSVPVTVTNPPPEGGTSELHSFTIKFPVPLLTALVPDTVAAGTSDFTLKVMGLNFRPDSVVNLNGEDLATAYVGPGELNTVVPSALIPSEGSYPLVVIDPDRQNSNVLDLTVIEPQPVITGFTPKEGIAGTVVTITGEKLDYSPKVAFAGTGATVLSVTSTEIKTVVPAGAQAGPITVTTIGGSTESSEPFSVLSRQDFSLNATPETVSLPAGAGASFVVSLASTGIEGFTGLVRLSVNTPPEITARFEPEYISAGTSSILTVEALSSLSSQTALTISGTSTMEGVERTRTAAVILAPVAAGTTTLTGQVLASRDARPIKGVTFVLGKMTAVTDDGGNFIFLDPPVGDQVLLLDGDTANTETAGYPSMIPVPVTITGGQDNKLPYRIYLHEVNTKTYTDIDSTKDTVVTDPAIPDYQMLIPAGTVIMGYDGEPNTRISVDTVAVDRLPIKPPPEGVYARTIFMYYFFKPGGGIPNRPVPVIMPNEAGALPGTRATLWYYDESFKPDPDSNQWKVFGMGTVSPDGKTIIPDPGVGIPKFCCGASFPAPPAPPPPPPPPDDCPKGVGDPVDPRTGVYFSKETDLAVQGDRVPVPLRIERTYRTLDNTVGPFGRGSSWNWGDTIYVIPSNNQSLTMVTVGESQYIFSRGPDGFYTNTRWPFLGGTRIRRNDDGTLTEYRRDGSIRKYRLYDTTMGRLYEVRDREGNTITLDLNTAGNPVKITDSSGRGFTITYNNNLITSITDQTGRQVRYTYDDNLNLVSVTGPDGRVTAYTYDEDDLLVSVTNPRDVTVVTNEYDAEGRVVRQTHAHADGGVYEFAYSVAGGIVTKTRVTDPNGNTTSYRFRNYYVAGKTDPYGQTTYYDRDYATNRLMVVTDPLGRVTRYTYDQNGNRTSIVDPAGNTTIIEYNQVFNKPVRITDALGNVWVLSYDTRGNLVSVTDPLGNSTVISYNKYGQPESVTDAEGNVYKFEYDGYGNLVKAADPLSNTVVMSYDALSRLIESTDPKGRTTRYTYDLVSRITEVTDAIKGNTEFTYDENGNLLSVTDAKGQTIRYAYDKGDRLVSMTDQLGRTESYEYDLHDNLVRLTDRKGQATTYSYDKKNRVTRVDYGDGSYTTYMYDAVGRLVSIYDLIAGPIEYVYSNTGCTACGGGGVDKVINEITSFGSISYEYDVLGRRTKMEVAGQEPVTYTYDADGRLTGVSTVDLLHGTLNFNIAYDALGRRASLTYPNGVTTDYTYDNASRLLNLEHLNPLNEVLESLSYVYDRNGNRTEIQRPDVTVKLPNPVSGITYNQANRMLTFRPESEPVKDITYDENGNMTSVTNSCGTTTYSWDARNRLVGIDGFTPDCSPLTASFKYDALGRRIQKTITHTDTVTMYLYDGLDIIQEIEDGVVSVNYLRTLNIDEPLARIESDGTVRYYQTDALGSVISLTDDNGNFVTQYNYSPFGEVTISGEVSDNPFQYTGRENDGTGLYYYRARYYSPEMKRFISEDPIMFAGGINFYVYVGNSPVNWVDSEGLWTFSFGIGGTAGLIDFNWNTANPTQTNISFVTPQLGGGINLCFSRDKPQDNCEADDFPSYDQPLEEQPLTYSVGWRYAGITFTDNFGSFCINLGASSGPLPINVGIPLSSYSHD